MIRDLRLALEDVLARLEGREPAPRPEPTGA